MLIVTIKADHEVDPPDELGRTRAGYREGMSDSELFEAARGSWTLDAARVAGEQYVLVVHGGVVRQAIEISGWVPTIGRRMAVEGTVLGPGHDVYDAYVGSETPVGPGRNPVRYFHPDRPV
jgi:hypothetical protein